MATCIGLYRIHHAGLTIGENTQVFPAVSDLQLYTIHDHPL
jgi:hypothetical protein